jgi:PAP2 superfamily
MTLYRYLLFINIFFLLLMQKAKAQNPDIRLSQQCISVLNDVMIHDITSPLVASRDYAYSLIAFYEGCRNGNSLYKSYAGQLNGLQSLPGTTPGLQYDWLIAGTTAFYKTSYSFVFSKDMFKKEWDSVIAPLKKRSVSAEVYKRSVAFGEQVADQILKWAKEDNYIHTRTLPRFTTSKNAGTWQQTAPDFMEAIEPYWNQIRPMTLSGPDEISIPAPVAFKSEKFIAECKEVFDTRKNITKDQKWTANFWDCNPFATQTIGHLMYSIKKLSPGGHWIGITGLAINKKSKSLVEAMASYSLVSVALFDAFIATWSEKYRSNYIRPVTAIQQLLSPAWEPILQTPPFPEYPSGHSVISMASAVILTSIYGNNFRYIDNVEKPYGVENRSFNSFYDAANEAAISRLYGGIHFREAIENGKELGKKIGNHVLEKVVLKTFKK